MHWLTGNWQSFSATAGKAALIYVAALLGLRLGERRTLAQWTVIDFVTAVAVGAIVGRTAIAGTQSFVTGAVALAVLVAIHRVASFARFRPLLGRLMDHRVRVLVAHGQVRRGELRRCAVTIEDLHSQLRQRGVFSLADVRYVLYETKGSITIVPEDVNSDAPLVASGIEQAVGYDKDDG